MDNFGHVSIYQNILHKNMHHFMLVNYELGTMPRILDLANFFLLAILTVDIILVGSSELRFSG